jgi:hypothetical protein
MNIALIYAVYVGFGTSDDNKHPRANSQRCGKSNYLFRVKDQNSY